MKYLFTAATLFAASVVADKRDLCSDGSVDDGGNWYCQAVEAITYTGVGGQGSYNRITNMNPDADPGSQCSSESRGYSGNLSPLDEEVSMHFRGPLQLKQFAVYTPTSSSKRSERRSAHVRRHAHAHGHGHQHHGREADPALGDMVTATIDGVVQTWLNNWSGQETSAPVASSSSAESSPTSTVDTHENWLPHLFGGGHGRHGGHDSSDEPSASSPAGPSSPSQTSSSSSSSGGWGRQAYYQASSNTSEGLVFLNHFGGSGSGTFDYTFGNSLSFSSPDGQSGASDRQTLEDCTLPSTAEVIIMSDRECSGDDCGYSRPDTVAFHGFDGPSKAFFFEFQMPDSGETASNQWDPANMPAIWMLNAQIPRTLQYGQAECSCWESGCGEFDLFEVLAPGDSRMKSTLHGNIAGGDSDYFKRPTDRTMKAAMILDNNNIHLKKLEDDFDFASDIDASTISEICGNTLTQSKLVSLFSLTG
ncbi:hypothetical protein KC343_g7509 [Hortaea werneckii]|uniref:glucan endo-1,3-beta-D-glucosidase n=1 Tax=Hortaea werneckii TaxID=91943 RepID=A0A3M7GC86_HORWE|nr:hypothetical protein KC317_g2248 [Hortaea werneckii]KAI7620185.1 hypothetical protein KC346_g4245 [Hortaea werneckii]KAI7622853.1 hypothetical protein KC343_g7509 [Hortaea werneckii]KAI7672072.1 hypothetical protein KC319_g5420 [Hortaea werneckii]KAI7707382.1 hypothetical protein KC322_g5511 [Hortaea werneckii]